MKIGIDIDDTIANTFEKIVEEALDYTRKNINPNFQLEDAGKTVTNLPYKEMFGWNDEQDEKFWKEHDFTKIILEITIKENAAEVIDRLYQNHEIYLITARSQMLGENTEALTKQWLAKNQVKYHHFYMNAEEKIDLCLENKIDLFIDDAYHHCKKMQENKIQTFMMSSKMNQNIQDHSIPVFHNWKEIGEELKVI